MCAKGIEESYKGKFTELDEIYSVPIIQKSGNRVSHLSNHPPTPLSLRYAQGMKTQPTM